MRVQWNSVLMNEISEKIMNEAKISVSYFLCTFNSAKFLYITEYKKEIQHVEMTN